MIYRTSIGLDVHARSIAADRLCAALGPRAVLEGGRPAPDRSECAETRGYQTGDR